MSPRFLTQTFQPRSLTVFNSNATAMTNWGRGMAVFRTWLIMQFHGPFRCSVRLPAYRFKLYSFRFKAQNGSDIKIGGLQVRNSGLNDPVCTSSPSNRPLREYCMEGIPWRLDSCTLRRVWRKERSSRPSEKYKPTDSIAFGRLCVATKGHACQDEQKRGCWRAGS